MKVLLDECLPRPLKFMLVSHEAYAVQEMGWAGIKNGRLLKLADQNKFDVFLTVDKNIPGEQKLTGLNLSIFILKAKTNRLEHLSSLIPAVLKALNDKPFPRVLKIQ